MSSKPPRDSLVSIQNHGYQFHTRKARNAAEAVVESCAVFFFFPPRQFSLPVYCGSGFWHYLNEVLLFFPLAHFFSSCIIACCKPPRDY